MNGELILNDIPLNDLNSTDQVERVVFRTGPYRNKVRSDYFEGLYDAYAVSNDLPGAGIKAPLLVFNIDDVITK